MHNPDVEIYRHYANDPTAKRKWKRSPSGVPRSRGRVCALRRRSVFGKESPVGPRSSKTSQRHFLSTLWLGPVSIVSALGVRHARVYTFPKLLFFCPAVSGDRSRLWRLNSWNIGFIPYLPYGCVN
ncbi:uncharacterized protein LOC143198265 [Rhynchophorus ferrugineus]|uniref:uncharacterized protein LOC143198265 n=1 Tax=Rhynchophorus ferrugineus TaxID=354439 RepID=UPI003FCE7C30